VSSNQRTSCAHRRLACIVISLCAVFSLSGCGSYPPIQSREGRQLIKRLYVACNSKDKQKLAGVEEELSKLTNAGTISKEEKSAFDSIITMARKDNWEAAEKASLRLADGQMGYEISGEKP
jgi:hypothetical protein